ncbi:molybdopterin-guanine dinucleotide biosynthesis protein MobA [Sphingomonas sp. Leaf357]|uniref:molybdenum cofactor guanylyltransferase n=1 Tax=Sphingomonas sp. Leaf357 TaxID=1736350 RepID=UPI0006FED3FE|nr:molybdenum cofactor guanylyltransferase [Sphingomonas sp. Leaf357]KQS03461.1 molybdopterin-guanine dinucleotide biosynthesis protein MobA [Sphingomonas sp. Leaf357]
MRVLGAVLAGGRATRFGSDKALALLEGRPLIAHAANVVHATVSKTVACGRDVAPEGMETIPDWPNPDLGPLGGVCGALRHAAAHGFDAVLTIGCDTPVLPTGLLDRLTSGGARFVRQTPIIGYWPTSLAEDLARHLSRDGDRSVRRWAASIGAIAVDAGEEIANFNFADDLDRFARRSVSPSPRR